MHMGIEHRENIEKTEAIHKTVTHKHQTRMATAIKQPNPTTKKTHRQNGRQNEQHNRNNAHRNSHVLLKNMKNIAAISQNWHAQTPTRTATAQT